MTWSPGRHSVRKIASSAARPLANASPRSPRSRAACRGLAFASGLAAEDALLARGVPAGRSRASCPATPTAGRSGWSRACSRTGASEYTSVPLADLDAVRAARPARNQGRLVRDADQPAARHRRHRRAGRDRARRRRAARRRQHLRLALPAAAARARRGRRRALDDEVPRRPLRRRRRRAGRARTPSSASSCAFHQNAMGAVRRPVRLRGSCCAASRRSACGWTGTARTPSGSSTSSPTTRPSTRCSTPGCPTPRARHRRAADARLRRHGVVHAARRRGDRAEGLRAGRRCSRSASRSAASSR